MPTTAPVQEWTIHDEIDDGAERETTGSGVLSCEATTLLLLSTSPF